MQWCLRPFKGTFLISILKQVMVGWHLIPRFKPLTQKQNLSSVNANCIRQAFKRGAEVLKKVLLW